MAASPSSVKGAGRDIQAKEEDFKLLILTTMAMYTVLIMIIMVILLAPRRPRSAHQESEESPVPPM